MTVLTMLAVPSTHISLPCAPKAALTLRAIWGELCDRASGAERSSSTATHGNAPGREASAIARSNRLFIDVSARDSKRPFAIDRSDMRLIKPVVLIDNKSKGIGE